MHTGMQCVKAHGTIRVACVYRCLSSDRVEFRQLFGIWSEDSGRSKWWHSPASCSLLFFFSSRRRHTRCSRDWSSDVCSSDLPPNRRAEGLGYVLTGSLIGAAGGPLVITTAQGTGPALGLDPAAFAWLLVPKIGRASCRERGEISVGAVSLKKKKEKNRDSFMC